ncbi:hypothetical protein G9P44_003882 [Scheffersomyces stipitis]|nr:hypothetical protein G9P44_003882 [Scheffersomyces stipitis]
MITPEAFRSSLVKITRWTPQTIPSRVLVALSGGVDSICLTYLLSQYSRLYCNNAIAINAITIDHGYRSGSNEEAKAVGKLVEKWGVQHIVKKLEYEKLPTEYSNFEEIARMKRYEKFEETCHQLDASHLFVAHNLNDQLETFIQRLQGNSSIYGLAGLKAQTSLPVQSQLPSAEKGRISVIRPLLQFEKSEIIDTCKQQNISWFEDSTNMDINLTKRNYLRHLINVAIPEKLAANDKYISISKAKLIESHEEITEMVESLEEKVDSLDQMAKTNGLLAVDPRNGSLSLKLSNDILTEDNIVIVGKYLYQLLYPFSSIRHYHWAYAKLERQLVPRIVQFAHSTGDSKLTYLNLTIILKNENGITTLDISRQPILRGALKEIAYEVDLTAEWSKWTLFDRRFWLRFKTSLFNGCKVTVAPYNHKEHKSKLHPDLEQQKALRFSKDMNNVPVVFHNDQIIAFPTYSMCFSQPMLEWEWHQKDNVYRL